MFQTKQQRRGGHEKRADGRDHVHPAPARQIGIGVDAARHARQPEEMLDDEGHVEADDISQNVHFPSRSESIRPLIFGNQ